MRRMAADAVTMDKIVALCKRRGLIFPASEIYGGIANTYDYGHYGVLLKRNVIDAWWQAMIGDRTDIVALDSAIIQHPKTWEASGHLAGFTDPLVDCKTCGQRFRADHLGELPCGRKPSKHPGETPECDLTEAREFNLMFETTIGPVKEAGATVYLRPETAQGIFLDFKTVLGFARKKPPFGIAQVGKSFRNEITPGNFIFRTLEFEQMEMEFFVPPDEAQQWHEHWLKERLDWYVRLGIRPDHLKLRPHDADELSHYSSATSDVEYLYPIGWSELEGIANRGDFDLTQHAQHSGEKLEYFDTASGERYVPHVIEPAAGVGRTVLAVLVRRLRRGGGRRRAAHRAQAAPAPGADQGRRAAARAQGRPARARPRGLRAAARPDAGRVRRGRLDRQALPPPGRDRHAVLRDDRPPVARGPHGHRARPRLARAGARGRRRPAGRPRRAPRRPLAHAEARGSLSRRRGRRRAPRARAADPIAVVRGVALAVQSYVNGRLGESIGSAELAAAVNNAVGSGRARAIAAAIGAIPRALRAWPGVRPWHLLGGLGGAMYVAAGAIGAPEVGVALLSVALVCGQTAGSLAADGIGLSPAGRQPVSRRAASRASR